MDVKYRLVLDTPFLTRSTISYGLMVHARDTKRWAITQRKHSIEFLLYFRGYYRLTHLPLILSSIVVDESNIIKQILKQNLKERSLSFRDFYINHLQLPMDGLEYALTRVEETKELVIQILEKLDLSKNILAWCWPKGRLQISSNRETPFDCAKREFIEEVEISLPIPLYISDTYISENIKTITGRNIESRYWIYVIPNEIPMTSPESHLEVSERMWVDTETCQSLIQHNQLFEQVKDMITSIT